MSRKSPENGTWTKVLGLQLLVILVLIDVTHVRLIMLKSGWHNSFELFSVGIAILQYWTLYKVTVSVRKNDPS